VLHLANALLWFTAFLLSTTLHEAAHAWAAWRLGDPTGFLVGQASLNPAPHIRREPFGMVVVPLLSFFTSGWMLGWASTPYDPRWALRHRRRHALMSLAGPAANLLLVLLAGALLRTGLQFDLFGLPSQLSFSQLVTASGQWAGVARFCSILFSLNLLLLAFNLLPVPPLDGSSAITLLMTDRQAARYLSFIHQGPWMLLGLLLAWNLFDRISAPLFHSALGLLFAGFTLH